MRDLIEVDASNPSSVLTALRAALDLSGPAVSPIPNPRAGVGGATAALPRVETAQTVEQRIAVVVETSGSTGRPKRVALSADAVLASAAASEAQLGGPGQWLLALPAHYIAGINVLARSIVSGIEPVVVADGAFMAESFLAATARMDSARRYTSLVPAQLARLLESDTAVDALRGFDRVLVGGQLAAATLVDSARTAGIAVTRTYGSSETCGGCVWDGSPIGDTQLRILDGRVEIAGSVLAEGYLDDPRRSAGAFRVRDGVRWYRSDDLGELHGGILTVTGRADDVIVSGGVKVSLSAVERLVQTLPGQTGAVVVGAPHPEWGETPVVVTDTAVSLDLLRETVAASLGRAAAPARVVHVDIMPTLASGKPDRVAIASLALD
ncbi:MAG: AMP-binding protein [Salinibacterium sp.]|nr:AMP-binding protein [Salinibacterium sp.]